MLQNSMGEIFPKGNEGKAFKQVVQSFNQENTDSQAPSLAWKIRKCFYRALRVLETKFRGVKWPCDSRTSSLRQRTDFSHLPYLGVAQTPGFPNRIILRQLCSLLIHNASVDAMCATAYLALCSPSPVGCLKSPSIIFLVVWRSAS